MVRFTFENGRTAEAIRLGDSTDLAVALRQIQLFPPHPVIVVVGGASGLEESDLNHLRPLFVRGLIPVAERLSAVVVDGGTDSGVMRLIGQEHAERGAKFPLIGVAVADKVAAPDTVPSDPTAIQLEPHHTHFVLVPGAKWGDESPWLARVASLLVGNLPSMTVLANGGNIAWQDVSESIGSGRPVLVIGGSGRTADILANALHGQVTDGRAGALVASGLVRSIDVTEGFDALSQALLSTLTLR